MYGFFSSGYIKILKVYAWQHRIVDFLFKTQGKGKKESLFRYAETMTTATMPSIEDFCKSLLKDNPGPLENYTANENFECPGKYLIDWVHVSKRVWIFREMAN